MAKIPESEQELELLVNCKTYPVVSTKYIETVCTGGVQRNGSFVRLYPVPFRLLDEDEQYKRWDVIRVKAYKDTKDQRPESWHWVVGTPIEIIDHIDSERVRWDWMKSAVFKSAADMTTQGKTNGLVEIEPLELYSKPLDRELSPRQQGVFEQGYLFIQPEQIAALAEQVPYEFRLKYREKTTGEEADIRVLAWSYYQGFLRRRSTPGGDTAALQAVIENVKASILSPERSVFAILGTHSRFGHWMISGLYHLPKAIRNRIGDKDESLF